MKYQLLFFIGYIFLTSCSKKINENDLNRDAEQLAMDLCHTQWVETKFIKLSFSRQFESRFKL